MSGEVNPFENPTTWDKIQIGQVKSPGLAEVGEFPRSYEWDVKKGKGTVGATTTFVQKPPAKGKVKFKLWTAQHFVEWDTFRPLLKYDPTKKNVQAIDIYHPSLADIDVTSVQTEEIGNIIHEGAGLYSITVEFLEFFPAPKQNATSTATGSTSTQKGTTPGTTADPVADAQQAQIAALLKQATAP